MKIMSKYKETINYLIFGVLTTIVNLVSYKILVLMSINLYMSVAIAWTIALLFSYVTTKLFVFDSKSWRISVIGKEIFLFVSSRIFSLGIDLIDMGIMVNVLHLEDMIAKFISNIIGAIINYVFSKFLIFKK